MPLVTLAQAKLHLRITTADGDPGDADIQLKLDQSTAIVLDYLKTSGDPAWTDITVPMQVTASILLMTARLFEQRGDAEQNDADLWMSVERLLMRLRDPALA